jgi:hypothetical protein
VKPKRPSWVGLFIGLRGFCKRAQKFSLGHVLAVAYGSGLASFQENLGLDSLKRSSVSRRWRANPTVRFNFLSIIELS